MPKKNSDPVAAVICLWEYVPPTKYLDEKRWKFVECYGIDDCGYACTESKYASNDRWSYDEFLDKKVYHNDKGEPLPDDTPDIDQYDYEHEAIPGRAVTMWTMTHGVSLVRFNPPEPVRWLSLQFHEKLKRNWIDTLEDAYTLLGGTANRAKKLVGLNLEDE